MSQLEGLLYGCGSGSLGSQGQPEVAFPVEAARVIGDLCDPS